MTEDQIFDATYQPPVTLLRQFYEDHQLLVLSYAEHNNEQPYRALSALLDQIGHDPRLKYIVLERYVENAPVLEAASVAAIDELRLRQQLQQPFTDSVDSVSPAIFSGQFSLCNSEWAFTWAEVLPRIRAINADRPNDHKLRATSVDGIVIASREKGFRLESYERDSVTAMVFHRRIWRELKRDTTAKAIVMYNIGHTIQGFTVTRGSDTTPPNFLGMFLRNHPEAKPRTALVLIEGASWLGERRYQFELTKQQVMRTPGRPLGIRTAPFRGVVTGRGDSVFTPEAVLSTRRLAFNGDALQSTATLSEMVDAIVLLQQAEQHPTQEGNVYFPQACPSP